MLGSRRLAAAFSYSMHRSVQQAGSESFHSRDEEPVLAQKQSARLGRAPSATSKLPLSWRTRQSCPLFPPPYLRSYPPYLPLGRPGAPLPEGLAFLASLPLAAAGAGRFAPAGGSFLTKNESRRACVLVPWRMQWSSRQQKSGVCVQDPRKEARVDEVEEYEDGDGGAAKVAAVCAPASFGGA